MNIDYNDFKTIKPRLVISKCVEFDKCRYNGLMIASPVVRALKDYCEMIPVCPEVEIGLGIPREAIRLVKDGDKISLVNSMNGTDVTDKMKNFSNSFIGKLDEPDGFILKSRSPSCGFRDVKIYPGVGKIGSLPLKAKGLFGKAVIENYPDTALEDEGRLTNQRIREHFLTRIFTTAVFKNLPQKMSALIDFHARNKYLFMSYNQSALKRAGKIVANHEGHGIEDVFRMYKIELINILRRVSKIGTNINVAQHIFGYFSKSLTSAEKDHFRQMITDYRDQRLPLSVVTGILTSWAYRFEDEYLIRQSFLNPFPQDLITIRDSGKGRIIK